MANLAALSRGGPAGVLIAWSIIGVMLINVTQAIGELAIVYPVSGGASLSFALAEYEVILTLDRATQVSTPSFAASWTRVSAWVRCLQSLLPPWRVIG